MHDYVCIYIYIYIYIHISIYTYLSLRDSQPPSGQFRAPWRKKLDGYILTEICLIIISSITIIIIIICDLFVITSIKDISYLGMCIY